MGIVEGVAALTALVGSYLMYKSNKKTNQTNEKLAQEAQTFEQQMWEQQNAYNSPTAQMQRYSDAGLNPNLIYGTGSVSAGNATTTPRPHVPSIMSEIQNLNLPNALSVMSQYQDFKNKKAIEDNTKAMTKVNLLKAITEAVRPSYMGTQMDQMMANIGLIKSNTSLTDLKRTGQRYANSNAKLQLEYAEPFLQERNRRLLLGNTLLEDQHGLNYWKKEILQSQNELLAENTQSVLLKNIAQEYENEMSGSLKQYNFTPKDPVWLRGLTKIADKIKAYLGFDANF